MADITTSERKNEFIRLLYSNPTIFTIIDSATAETGIDLVNTNIFPRLKIDFTIEDAGTYIGLKIDYPSITSNEDLKNCVITFMIISHINHIQTATGDSRTDLLAEEIIKMFNFNYDSEFTLKLEKDVEDPFDKNFYYRRLTFSTLAINSLDNKMNNGVR